MERDWSRDAVRDPRLVRASWALLAPAFGLSVLLLAQPARGAEDDARLWATFGLQATLAGPVTGSLIIQPRFSQDMGELERVLLRPSISLEVSKPLVLTLGYDAHLIEDPRDKTEHRAWQELGLQTPVDSFAVHHRLRLEERFLEDVAGTALRLRYRLRLGHPIGDSAFDAVVSNEVFFDLNSRRGGPRSGFGEDRAFAGLRRQVHQALALEGGYQLQYVDRPGRDAANHVLMLGLNATLR